MNRFSATAGVVVCLWATALPLRLAASDWSIDPGMNNPVSTAFDRQVDAVAISDGETGVIVAWEDLRDQLSFRPYVQRINGNGNAVWTTDGVLLSDVVANQVNPEITSDGAGGAIVVWVDTRTDPLGDLYAQRIDAAGNLVWASGGVAIAVATSDQGSQSLIADGTGGAIITWADRRSSELDIYAQRIDANGAVQWAANGVAVCQAAGNQFSPRLTSDSAGGAIIAWDDRRNDPTNADIFAQRIDNAGTALWTADGIGIVQQPFQQDDYSLVSSFANGAFIVWDDARDAPAGDNQIYIQRVLGDGTFVFAVNGMQVSTLPGGHHREPQMVASGSVITTPGRPVSILWRFLDASDDELAFQYVYPDGSIFGAETLIDPGDSVDQRNPHLVANTNEGGIFVAWEDDSLGPNTSDIFVTKHLGSFQYTEGGVPVCVASGAQRSPLVVSDNQGGVIVVWEDDRQSSIQTDLYAQRIDLVGAIGYASPDITSIVDNPQDQGGQAVVSWQRSRLDVIGVPTIIEYSLWRRNLNAAKAVYHLDTEPYQTRLEQALAAGLPRDLSRIRTLAGWELVGTTPAVNLPDYAMTAPTYGDSTDSGLPFTAYQVLVEFDFGFYYSAVDSGYSVDNLTPGKPLNLVGETFNDDALLTWETGEEHSEDVVAYNVYRNAAPGVAVIPGNLLVTVPDLTYLDTTTGGALHYYIVTALDPSNQESPPSNEVSVPLVSGAGDDQLPTTLSVLTNAPNPTDGVTMLRFGLPVASDVELRVFDVAGRRVFGETLPDRLPGWHEHVFHGRNDAGRTLPAGIYFYTIRAKEASRTSRLIIAR